MNKSKYAINESPVYVSDNMTGKMSGIPSISTNNLCNERCKAHKNIDGCICQHCFADSTVKHYKDLRNHLTENSELLSGSVLDLDSLPIFGNVRFVRFESFGDLINVTHAINYLNICKVNPDVVFTIWTKNPDILDKAIKQEGKPGNLICILSSYMLNTTAKITYAWVDKVFTVYTDKYIKENNVEINCGARNCVNCHRCYSLNDKTVYISERLK